MKIIYEIGDFVQRIDHIESQMLQIIALRPDGAVVKIYSDNLSSIDDYPEEFKTGTLLPFTAFKPAHYTFNRSTIVVDGTEISMSELRHSQKKLDI